MTNKVGRPTKHNPELVQKALEYIRDYNSVIYLPSITEMCEKIGVSRTQFYEWIKRDDRETESIVTALRARLDELEPAFWARIERNRQIREEQRRERQKQFKIIYENVY